MRYIIFQIFICSSLIWVQHTSQNFITPVRWRCMCIETRLPIQLKEVKRGYLFSLKRKKATLPRFYPRNPSRIPNQNIFWSRLFNLFAYNSTVNLYPWASDSIIVEIIWKFSKWIDTKLFSGIIFHRWPTWQLLPQ